MILLLSLHGRLTNRGRDAVASHLAGGGASARPAGSARALAGGHHVSSAKVAPPWSCIEAGPAGPRGPGGARQLVGEPPSRPCGATRWASLSGTTSWACCCGRRASNICPGFPPLHDIKQAALLVLHHRGDGDRQGRGPRVQPGRPGTHRDPTSRAASSAAEPTPPEAPRRTGSAAPARRRKASGRRCARIPPP